MDLSNNIDLTVDENNLQECALMMSESEPWLTLNRNYNECLDAVHGDHKEVYIVRDHSEIVGFAVLQMVGAFKGYIQSICISPERRGQGIGTALLEFCENRIFQISPNVFMCVSSFNTEAAKLYYSLGYEKVGVLENFVVQGNSEILLRRTIGSISEFRKK